MADGGSVQKVPGIPPHIKEVYRTVWEIRQRSILDMAADRGAFIDQSQSLNAFVAQPDYSKLTSMHFHGWRKGLKTGMYYLRTKAAANAIQFTVDASPTASTSSTPNQPSSDNSTSSGSTGDDDGGGSSVSGKISSVPGQLIYGDACVSCSG